MAKLEIKYRLEGKALPPRPIKVAIGDWGGSAERKMENGSRPEPWHCPAFTDACIHGFELLYQYETELQVVNVNGKVEFQWNLEKEPGEGGDPRRDFTLSHMPTTDYLFGTSLDIQVPPGYILRVEPHPRFYRDETETVAPAVCGQVQTEWFPKKLFVVFKIPAPGQRHIFRKGEPYAQALCIPRDDFVLTEMTPEERERRRNLEEQIMFARTLIAGRVWVSSHNRVFTDYYNVLARVFARKGLAGVEEVVREGVERYRQNLPTGKSAPEYIDLAKAAIEKEQFIEAREILQHVLEKVDPNNPQAYRHLALLQWRWKVPHGAVIAMRRAVELAPNQPAFRLDMAILYRLVNRPDLARQELQTALAIDPSCAPARQLLGELTVGSSDWAPAN
jgi:tetratricopeptide (TPR) repeat protein